MKLSLREEQITIAMIGDDNYDSENNIVHFTLEKGLRGNHSSIIYSKGYTKPAILYSFFGK